MRPRGEEAIGTNVGAVLPALMMFAFPLELLRFIAWTWLTAAILLLLTLAAALVVGSMVLPYTDPELYRLVTKQRQR